MQKFYDESNRPQVEYQEDIIESLKRIPFLQQFLIDSADVENGIDIVFSSEKINKYMHGTYVSPDDEVTSSMINAILNEAGYRGDIDNILKSKEADNETTQMD